MFDDVRVKLLVLYYGIFQLFHIVLNTSLLAGVMSFDTFPAAPPQGWQGYELSALHGLALSDDIGAALGVAFAVGFLLRRAWSIWFGLVSLAGYTFGIIPFSFITVYAWEHHKLTYFGVLAISIPLFILFYIISREFFRLTGRVNQLR